jgi:hypothetical protein
MRMRMRVLLERKSETTKALVRDMNRIQACAEGLVVSSLGTEQEEFARRASDTIVQQVNLVIHALRPRPNKEEQTINLDDLYAVLAELNAIS